MNVALLADTLFGGGSEGVLRRLALGLAGRGHGVFVYCLKRAGIPTAPLRAAGVVVREAHSAGRDPALLWRLARWLRRDGIQLVHAHSCAALVCVFPTAKLLGLPLVHVRHGWPLGGPSRYVRLADRLSPFVECVVVVCATGRARLPRGRLARRAVHIPNGLDPPAPLPAARARQRLEALCGQALRGPLVLSVANIRPEKDICGLLRAFALLRRRQPAAALVCLGAMPDPDYRAAVLHQRRTLGLEHQAFLPGHVADAARLMSAADVLCLSSRTEGMPNVVLEAMAQQVPIVATAVGDVGRLGPQADPCRLLLRHNETALLVPPAAPAALAAALEQALADPPAARRRAARAAEDYALYYTSSRMVARYERAHQACLRGRPAARADRPAPARPRERPAPVLMVGPGAPQIGGMVSAIEGLTASALGTQYVLHHFATTCRRRCAEAGRPRGPLARLAQGCAAAGRHVGALLRLGGRVLGTRAALVHIHTCSYFTFYRNLLDLVLVKLLGCKAILHIRGGRFERFCRQAGPTGRRLIRAGCTLADAVVVLSPGWRERLAPFLGGAQIVAVPNGVVLPASPLRRQPGAPGGCRFLFLGRLSQAKGLGDLLAAARLLRRDGVQFELLIAGPASGAQRAHWQQRVRRAGLAGVTRLLDPVRSGQRERLFGCVDCLVHPSHSEGLPFTVLEAAAAGLPVIATAVGAVPELLSSGAGEACWPAARPARLDGLLSGRLAAPLVPPRDPLALARWMTRLARDPDLRACIGRTLRARVAARYSIEREAGQIARLYRSVLARQSGDPAAPGARRLSADRRPAMAAT